MKPPPPPAWIMQPAPDRPVLSERKKAISKTLMA
nr:hypothetical protein [Shigella sonnei]